MTPLAAASALATDQPPVRQSVTVPLHELLFAFADMIRAGTEPDHAHGASLALAELRRLRSEGHAASCQCHRCPELRRICCAAGLSGEVQ